MTKISANDSSRVATPNPATAVTPYSATILVMIPMDSGRIMLAAAAGMPIWKIRRPELRSRAKERAENENSRSLRARIQRPKSIDDDLARTVATAAPAISNLGIGPMPNISIGSRTIFPRIAIAMRIPGVRVSPHAWIT